MPLKASLKPNQAMTRCSFFGALLPFVASLRGTPQPVPGQVICEYVMFRSNRVKMLSRVWDWNGDLICDKQILPLIKPLTGLTKELKMEQEMDVRIK